MSGVDDGVGEILGTISALGLERNTLVVFTADHGLCAGHHGFWGMSDHGRPLMMFDENLRVPLISRHPDRIAAEGTCAMTTCNYDLFPSLVEYLGLPDQYRTAPALPGRSYFRTLLGEELSWGEEITFHEYENTRTVRTQEWKLTRRFPDGPDDLYHLQDDAKERYNLIDDPEHISVARDLSGKLDAFFDRYSIPKHDLWRGGDTKAGRSIPELRRYGSG